MRRWIWASKGKWALVCAPSKGLGKGCAAALVAEGVNVVDHRARRRGARRRPRPSCARSARGEVRAVAGDITATEVGARRAAPPVRRSTSSSTTPAGRRRATSGNWDRETLDQGDRRQHADADQADARRPSTRWPSAASAAHASTSPRARSRRRSTARPVERRAQRLTGFVAGLARKRASPRPGRHHQRSASRRVFDTDRSARDDGRACGNARQAGAGAESPRRGSARIPAHGASATPQEFGAICAFLCSVHAGYHDTGQNVLRRRRRRTGNVLSVARLSCRRCRLSALASSSTDRNGPSTISPQPRQAQCRCAGWRSSSASAGRGRVELVVVADPHLRQRAGQAAARRRCCSRTCAAPWRRCRPVREQVGPQGGEGQVRARVRSFHRARAGPPKRANRAPRGGGQERGMLTDSASSPNRGHHREPHHPAST